MYWPTVVSVVTVLVGLGFSSDIRADKSNGFAATSIFPQHAQSFKFQSFELNGVAKHPKLCSHSRDCLKFCVDDSPPFSCCVANLCLCQPPQTYPKKCPDLKQLLFASFILTDNGDTSYYQVQIVTTDQEFFEVPLFYRYFYESDQQMNFVKYTTFGVVSSEKYFEFYYSMLEVPEKYTPLRGFGANSETVPSQTYSKRVVTLNEFANSSKLENSMR